VSKAFTTDSDDEENTFDAPALPPGTRNYITPAGAARLREEVDRLNEERKHLGTSVEGKGRAQTIERRLRQLIDRVEALEVIDPATQPKDRILFGATVKVLDDGKEAEWRIVGLDEIDLDRGWISWMSPLALALIDKHVGDVIPFLDRRLTILKISY